MNWNDITIEQYQQLYPILQNKTLTPSDRDTKLISILTGLTEAQIDHRPVSWFREQREALKFIVEGEIGGQAQTIIRGYKRRYRLQHDVAKMPSGRYAEIKSWAVGEALVIERMHMIMASMCVPQRRMTWRGIELPVWVDDKFEAENHADYAGDLLGAKFADCYHTMVFFYHLYAASIKTMRGYMIALMTQTGEMTEKEAAQVVDHLVNSMDGFITANRLPSMRAYQLKRLGRLVREGFSMPWFTSKPKPITTGN